MQMRGPGDMEGTQQSGIAFNCKLPTWPKTARFCKRPATKLMPCSTATNVWNGPKTTSFAKS